MRKSVEFLKKTDKINLKELEEEKERSLKKCRRLNSFYYSGRKQKNKLKFEIKKPKDNKSNNISELKDDSNKLNKVDNSYENNKNKKIIQTNKNDQINLNKNSDIKKDSKLELDLDRYRIKKNDKINQSKKRYKSNNISERKNRAKSSNLKFVLYNEEDNFKRDKKRCNLFFLFLRF